MKIHLTREESKEMQDFIKDAARTYLWLRKSMQLPEDAVLECKLRYDGTYEIETDDKNFKYDSFGKKWLKQTEDGWVEYEGS